MILPRLLTAVVGIPLVLALIHWGSIPYTVFVLAVVGLALLEYGAVLQAGGLAIQPWLCVGAGLAMATAVAVSPPSLDPEGRGLWPACALTMVVALSVLRELFRREHSWERAAMTVLGVLFVSWTLAHLILLRGLRPGGEKLTYALFAWIWLSDCAAYLAGTRWGKRKLAPQVSPHKTWEGFLGAAIIGALAALATELIASLGLGPAGAAFLGTAVAAAAQVSDLSESLVKRRAGVKDSGSLLPGHGGVLDRFDSFYLAAPFFYYFWAFRLL